MNTIIEKNGKRYFNPDCVKLVGATIQLYGGTGLQWTLSDCALNNSGIIRAWMKESLEAALGHTIPDAPKEPRVRFFRFESEQAIYRCVNDDPAEHFRERSWHRCRPGNEAPALLRAGFKEVSHAEAIDFIGRSVCGVPAEEPQ